MLRLRTALLFTLLFTLFLASRARTARADDEPTLRFDFTSGVIAGSAQSPLVSTFSLSPALILDLGAQLSPHAALFARVEGGTSLLTSEGGAYLIGEWTPHPVISLATGVGYEGMSFLSVGGCDKAVMTCIDNSWSGISVPFIVGFNLQPRRAAVAGQGERHGRLRLELEAAGGYEARTQTWGMHAFAGVAVTWM
jgi:hypothetical protein